MLQYWLTGSVFLVCMITDIRHRVICKKVVGAYIVLAVLGQVLSGIALLEGNLAIDEKVVQVAMTSLGGILTGVIPGCIGLLLAWMTREAFGYGDAFLILGCGISLGLAECMELVVWAFFFSGIWSLVLLVWRRADRKREIPFVPFLMIGFVMTVLG